jgi:hypothetical protein
VWSPLMGVIRWALLASRGECEVTDREVHPVLPAQPLGERPELVSRDVDDTTAVFADHGDRAVPDPAIARRTVSEVHMVDQPYALEVRQHPVQGGAVDIGMAFRELIDGDPARRPIEVLEQRSAGPRDPPTRDAEAVERVVEADLRRASSRRRLGHQ